MENRRKLSAHEYLIIFLALAPVVVILGIGVFVIGFLAEFIL